MKTTCGVRQGQNAGSIRLSPVAGTRQLEELLAQKGVILLDAPISGQALGKPGFDADNTEAIKSWQNEQ